MQTILENLMQNIEEMKEEQTNAVKDIQKILNIMENDQEYNLDPK